MTDQAVLGRVRGNRTNHGRGPVVPVPSET